MKLYHKQLGFPKDITVPNDVILRLYYTRHAHERRVRENLYSLLVVPKFVKATNRNITEIAVQNNLLKKLTIRTHYDHKHDIVLILEPSFDYKIAKVITFWLVKKYDVSFNKEKYELCN